MITKELKEQRRRKAAATPWDSVSQRILTPSYEDFQQGRNTLEDMQKHYAKEAKTIGARPDDKPPAPAVTPDTPGGPEVDPKGVIYAGEGELEGDAKKKKKKKPTILTSSAGLLSDASTYSPSLLGS